MSHYYLGAFTGWLLQIRNKFLRNSSYPTKFSNSGSDNWQPLVCNDPLFSSNDFFPPMFYASFSKSINLAPRVADKVKNKQI